MRRPPTALGDILDVEGFSATVVRRSIAKRMPEDEIQEAIAEGVTLLYELHQVWDPDRCASFYRYCTTYLQLRLIDWWRREARQRNLAHRNAATKSYTYHGRVSLDDETAAGNFEHDGDGGWTGQKNGGEMDAMLVFHETSRLGD